MRGRGVGALAALRRRPLLATFVGWSRLSQGDLDGVEAWLDAAQAGLDTTPPSTIPTAGSPAEAARDREGEVRSLPAMIAVYRAAVAQARGEVDGTVSHARRALALAGPEDHFPRGAAAGFVGLAAWAAGDLGTAVGTFTEAVASLPAAGMVADGSGRPTSYSRPAAPCCPRVARAWPLRRTTARPAGGCSRSPESLVRPGATHGAIFVPSWRHEPRGVCGRPPP